MTSKIGDGVRAQEYATLKVCCRGTWFYLYTFCSFK